MPSYKGHLIGGVVIWAILALAFVSYAQSVTTIFIWLLWALAGALFPDIDTKSKGQQLFYFLLIPSYLYMFLHGWLGSCVVLAVVSIIPLMVKHRGVLHSLWFVVLVPSMGAWLVLQYMPIKQIHVLGALVFFVGGALSHLWLDFGPRKMIRW